MTKKLMYVGMFFLLIFLMLFISSCRKDKVIVKDTTEIITDDLQNNKDLAFFLSNEKTFNLLAPTAYNWEKPADQIGKRNDETDALKSIIIEINNQLSEKYVNHIINKSGFPLWDASVLELFEDGGYTLFTPVFKEGSDKIEAMFTYTSTASGKVAYDLETREDLEASAADLKDPNFLIKVSLFQHYDKLLFNYEPPIYADWKEFDVDDVEDCFATLTSRYIDTGGLPNFFYVICSVGCFNELNAAGILDTPEERSWAAANCKYANAIDNFLEESDASNVLKNETAQFFVDLGMVNNLVTFALFKEMLNQFTSYIEDPDDEISIINLIDFFELNNLNIQSLDVYGLITVESNQSVNISEGWNNMNAADYFANSAVRRNELKNMYEMPMGYAAPGYVTSNWACRVLGKAHEDATLNSLGLPLNNTLPGAGISGKQPDGYKTRELYEYIFPSLTSYSQPIIVEMKYKSTTGDFDYSSQASQFAAYRNYLKNPDNTHLPNTTLLHGLYMILPSDKGLDTSSVINACTMDNIPLYLSGVEYDIDNPKIIRVSYPKLLNISSLNRSAYLFSWFSDGAWSASLARLMYKAFDNLEADIDFSFNQWANHFEETTLIPMYSDNCTTDD